MFTLGQTHGSLRTGRLTTPHGIIETPFFMPIATKGSVKHLLPGEVSALGAQVILGNTYHLWLRPGDDLIARSGDLHGFSGWGGPILTDSGGYQAFSLGSKANERGFRNSVEISEEGVTFTDPIDGSRHFLSPEKSIDIQLNLGSDMIMVLDICASYPCSYETASDAVDRTTRWAYRSLEHFHKRIVGRKGPRPLLFCIIQGSLFRDLRIKSANDLLNLRLGDETTDGTAWDGVAIGGVAVGEPREKLRDVLEWVLPILPSDRPRYLMGLGRPDEIAFAVRSGIDMFDCVIPTREGRHGRIFSWKSDHEAGFRDDNPTGLEFYETLNIANSKHRDDFSPLDATCDCVACEGAFTRAYIHHLFSVGEPLGAKLATVHNLRFYMRLMKRLRESVTETDVTQSPTF